MCYSTLLPAAQALLLRTAAAQPFPKHHTGAEAARRLRSSPALQDPAPKATRTCWKLAPCQAQLARFAEN